MKNYPDTSGRVSVRPPETLPTNTPEINLRETTKMETPQQPIFEEQPKWALYSKGILGPLFIILAMALKLVGVELDLEPVKEIIALVLSDGTITAAAVLALIGRYTASKKVVLWPTKSAE